MRLLGRFERQYESHVWDGGNQQSGNHLASSACETRRREHRDRVEHTTREGSERVLAGCVIAGIDAPTGHAAAIDLRCIGEGSLGRAKHNALRHWIIEAMGQSGVSLVVTASAMDGDD